MSTVEAHLLELAQAATSDLPEVTWKRMFGCQVIFARGGCQGAAEAQEEASREEDASPLAPRVTPPAHSPRSHELPPHA